MKNIIKLNERELHQLISESVNRILNEDYGDTEDVYLYDVLRHISESEIDDILQEHVYNENDEDLGQLGYLHIKYTPEFKEPSIF